MEFKVKRRFLAEWLKCERFKLKTSRLMRKHQLNVIYCYLSGSCAASLLHSVISMVVIVMEAFKIFIFHSGSLYSLAIFSACQILSLFLTETQKITCNETKTGMPANMCT